jgi:signal peptidase I
VLDNLRPRVGPAVSLVCWLYLTVAVSLGAWVVSTNVFLHWQPVVVTSGSMAPKVLAGDVVMMAGPTGQRLEKGDLIRFRTADGTTVIHRIDGVNKDGSYQTKGDANPTPDPTPVAAKNVLGVGRLLVPVIGRPWLWRSAGQTAILAAWFVTTAAAAFAAFRPMVRRRRGAALPSPSPSSAIEASHA